MTEEFVVTQIPNAEDIKLIAFYNSFKDYYPRCELETKYWFTKNIKSDYTVIDAGANIGYYSVLFSRLADKGKIIAFEPTKTYEMLCDNLTYNSCDNVTVEKMALGKSTGEIVDNIFRIWGEPSECDKYAFTTLDDYVESKAIDKLDVIKVDVDGFEYDFLVGAKNTLARFNPYIIIELNSALATRGLAPSDILEWFYKEGYTQSMILDKENYIFKKNEDVSKLLPSRLAYSIDMHALDYSVIPELN